jgi:hypothetical protein
LHGLLAFLKIIFIFFITAHQHFVLQGAGVFFGRNNGRGVLGPNALGMPSLLLTERVPIDPVAFSNVLGMPSLLPKERIPMP